VVQGIACSPAAGEYTVLAKLHVGEGKRLARELTAHKSKFLPDEPCGSMIDEVLQWVFALDNVFQCEMCQNVLEIERALVLEASGSTKRDFLQTGDLQCVLSLGCCSKISW